MSFLTDRKVLKEMSYYDTNSVGICEVRNSTYFFLLIDEDDYWIYIPVYKNNGMFYYEFNKNWVHEFNGQQVIIQSKNSKDSFLRYYDVDLRKYQDTVKFKK